MHRLKSTLEHLAIDAGYPDLHNKLGLKACAMVYFKSQGLFKPRLQIYEPQPTGHLTELIIKSDIISSGMTVRYSYKNKLGLPRAFFQSTKALIEFIHKTHEPQWTTIIHEYFSIDRSYEINLERRGWSIESVPGIWESNNIQQPDEMHCKNGTCHARIFSKERVGLSISPSGSYKTEAKPLTRNKTILVANKLTPIISTLRSDLLDALPINIHFIETNTHDWNFLNIRSGYSSEEQTATIGRNKPSNCYIAKSIQDLSLWNGKTPLVLSFPIERGKEYDVISIAKQLPTHHSKTVYVEFGLLSHPAIILRELGFNVLPSRSLYSPFDQNNYETFKFELHQ